MKRRNFLKLIFAASVTPPTVLLSLFQGESHADVPEYIPPQNRWGIEGSRTIMKGDVVVLTDDGRIEPITYPSQLETETIIGVASADTKDGKGYIDLIDTFAYDEPKLRRLFNSRNRPKSTLFIKTGR